MPSIDAPACVRKKGASAVEKEWSAIIAGVLWAGSPDFDLPMSDKDICGNRQRTHAHSETNHHAVIRPGREPRDVHERCKVFLEQSTNRLDLFFCGLAVDGNTANMTDEDEEAVCSSKRSLRTVQALAEVHCRCG